MDKKSAKYSVLGWSKKSDLAGVWCVVRPAAGPPTFMKAVKPRGKFAQHEAASAQDPPEASLRRGRGPAKSEVFQAERATGKFSGFRRLFWIFTNFVKAFPELFFLQKVMKMSTF